jgi:hypothetical protein
MICCGFVEEGTENVPISLSLSFNQDRYLTDSSAMFFTVALFNHFVFVLFYNYFSSLCTAGHYYI